MRKTLRLYSLGSAAVVLLTAPATSPFIATWAHQGNILFVGFNARNPGSGRMPGPPTVGPLVERHGFLY
jgi:hypothetical protein